MRTRIYILIALALAITTSALSPAKAESAVEIEYKVKAAFLYNFIKFIDWPDEKITDTNEIVIGIICDTKYEPIFKPLAKKTVKDKKISVRFLPVASLPTKPEDNENGKYEPTIQFMKSCHVLFLCGPVNQKISTSLHFINSEPVLTVGESDKFLQNGGIINFVVKENKVRFEVNLVSAEKAKLKIRSRLLRLALKVIDKETEG